MTVNLSKLYPLQAKLDQDIAKRHHITYQQTFYKRLLALIVELGEFANETRAFKYWSYKKSSPKNVILEEYADGLHFILSLGIYLKTKKMVYTIKEDKKIDLTKAILISYEEAIKLKDHYNQKQYEKAMNAYLNLISYLHYQPSEVIKAYLSKLEVNYSRQINHY
ncbi:MAG: dUTP diphosphatase [Bacilli bacterium]|nr:dUTP diphosphatase [Bacilli bacterium]